MLRKGEGRGDGEEDGEGNGEGHYLHAYFLVLNLFVLFAKGIGGFRISFFVDMV